MLQSSRTGRQTLTTPQKIMLLRAATGVDFCQASDINQMSAAEFERRCSDAERNIKRADLSEVDRGTLLAYLSTVTYLVQEVRSEDYALRREREQQLKQEQRITRRRLAQVAAFSANQAQLVPSTS